MMKRRDAPVRAADDSHDRPWSILSAHRGPVFRLSATSFLGGLLEAGFLVAVTRTALAVAEGDQRVAVFSGRTVAVTTALGAAFVLAIARGGAALLARWEGARLSAVVAAALRLRLGQAFLRSTWEVQHGERAGRLQELLTTFSHRGAELVSGVTHAVVAMFSLIALLAAALIIDPLASSIVFLVVSLLASALRPLRRLVRRRAKAAARSGMTFSTSLAEVSNMGMEIHVFDVREQIEERVRSSIAENAQANQRLHFATGALPIVYTSLAYIALVGGLAALTQIGQANIASAAAIIIVMLRSLSYGQAIQASSATINASRPFLASLREEAERYESAASPTGGAAVGSVGALTMHSVNFEYESNVPVLSGIDLTIESREVVGVVGPSGSGKSTLVQLLLALRDPTSGRVLADGRDVRELSRSEWARHVTFVPQQAHLLAGTISDNIRFLRDDVTQEQIEQASRLANLHNDVMAFPDGYDRQVGEQGSHLSGGQQQRLIIARALVEDPDVLILDEPTSSLDVRSEHLIRQTLDKLRQRMTIVIIAHRLSTLSICDRIMVIQDGELKAFDAPEKLETSSEFYSEALRLSGLR